MTETAAFEALRASPLATELTEAQCRTLSTLLALSLIHISEPTRPY